MAREKHSRRLVKFWWFAAFTAGVAVGAISLSVTGAQKTAWMVGFLGAMACAVAIYEQFSDSAGPRFTSRPRRVWTRRGWSQPTAPRTPVKTKPAPRRGQLRVIDGRKPAPSANSPETSPPSSDAPPTSGAS